MKVTPIGVGPQLTPEQRALARSVPKVAIHAAHEVLRRFGPILPLDELVSVGHLAVANAALTYDPQRGGSFSRWAYYRAMERMVDAGRSERKQRRVQAAQRAAFGFLLAEPSRDEGDPFQETPQSLAGELDAFATNMLFAMIHADTGVENDPEGLNAEREIWERARRSLDHVIEALPAEDRELLRLVYEHDHNFTEAAQLLNKKYWTVVREHHALMKLLREKLARVGVNEAPQVFDAPPDAFAVRERFDTIPDGR